MDSRAVEKIHKENKNAHSWFIDEPIKDWARVMIDQDLKIPYNITNFVESFNGKMSGSDINPSWSSLRLSCANLCLL